MPRPCSSLRSVWRAETSGPLSRWVINAREVPERPFTLGPRTTANKHAL
jgi:hypothetical protein